MSALDCWKKTSPGYMFVHPEKEPGIARKSGKPSSANRLSFVAAVLSGVALVVVVGLAAAFTVLVCVPEDQLQKLLGSETRIKGEKIKAFACISCSKLLRDPADDVSSDPLLEKLDVEVKDGMEECCAYTSEQVAALFESLVRLNDLPPQSLPSYEPSDFKFSPVSAHKRLYPAIMSDGFGVPKFPTRAEVCELKQDDSPYGLEHHRSVNISKNGLRIVYGGVYYVYASIQFRPQSIHPCEDFDHQTFVGYVEKISYRLSGAQNILKVSHTCCDKCDNSQETRFTGGVFVLEPGDKIRVKVLGYELVYFEAESSFVGLAMLGSPPPD